MGRDRGHAIFVTGPPSAGKTIVTKEVTKELSAFASISGDEVIRNLLPPEERISRRKEAFAAILDRVEAELAVRNIVVDASLPESHVEQVRARFGSESLFVLLRVDEEEWRRREHARRDRKPIDWNAQLLATVFSAAGADESYDLVIDTTETSPEAAAMLIKAAVLERWGLYTA